MADKQNLAKESQLALKQDTLIAGANITIAPDGKTISAAGPTSITVTPIYQAGTLVAAIVVNGNTTNIYAPAQHGDNSNQNLAAPFSASATYAVGNYVIYQENLYKCITAITTAAAWDATKWTRVLITNEMGSGSGGDYANQNIADTYDITATYDVGDYVIFNSLLYKCITAVTTPGVWNSSYWAHVLVTNEMGSGGGGGNVDDVYVNGTSVLDANKIAQVKSYKEVSQAEYDALPASKESDDVLYCIYDQATADTTVAPIIYSENEREIGVWYDGRPLYQKSYTFPSAVSFSSGSWVNAIPWDNVMLPKAVLGGYTSGTDSYNCWSVGVDNGYIQLFNSRGYANSIIGFTLQYTKTTDQPGSGKYAPSGVPAVHYSENEQIVGTWTNGSTLYERSYTIPQTSSGYTIFDFTGLNINEVINVYTHEGIAFAPSTSDVPYGSAPLCGYIQSYAGDLGFVGYVTHDANTGIYQFHYRVGSYLSGGTARVIVRYNKITS